MFDNLSEAAASGTPNTDTELPEIEIHAAPAGADGGTQQTGPETAEDAPVTPQPPVQEGNSGTGGNAIPGSGGAIVLPEIP